MKNNDSSKFKKGGVSIFLVVAACLLVSVVIASFIRLVIRDQQQASKQDISQSAYDSAQAGVEDAKRFLNVYAGTCGSGTLSGKQNGIDCDVIKNAVKTEIGSQSCNILNSAGVGASTGETKVQTSTSQNDVQLDQAYTCVKIQRETENFVGELSDGADKLVPLRALAPYNQVRIDWFMAADLPDPSNRNIDLKSENTTPKSVNGVAMLPFPENDGKTWTTSHPAVLNSQFISLGAGGNNMADYDDKPFRDGGAGASSLMLYPSTGGPNSVNLSFDTRTKGGTNSPSQIKCTNLDKTYACTATINTAMINTSTTAFLKLHALYNKSSFSVSLYNNGNLVKFDGAQPKVDSTGRANDNFRRVESRIETTNDNFPMPDFAVDNSDGASPLCKDFWVTNIRQEFACK